VNGSEEFRRSAQGSRNGFIVTETATGSNIHMSKNQGTPATETAPLFV